jgi:hypothetical protein
VVTKYSECFFTSHSSSSACQYTVRMQMLVQDQEVDFLILSWPRRLHPRYPESHCGQGPREALLCSHWTGYKLPANIPRPAAVLSLLPQEPTRPHDWASTNLLSCIVSFYTVPWTG